MQFSLNNYRRLPSSENALPYPLVARQREPGQQAGSHRGLIGLTSLSVRKGWLSAFLFSWMILSAIFASGCDPGGLKRYEVVGTVLVDERPAERVMVQFHALDETLQGDDRYPVCLTDAEGKFRLGDQSLKAGALEGSYRVTFSWLSSAGLDAVDKLRGAYADEKVSDFTVTVPTEGELNFLLKSNSVPLLRQ